MSLVQQLSVYFTFSPYVPLSQHPYYINKMLDSKVAI